MCHCSKTPRFIFKHPDMPHVTQSPWIRQTSYKQCFGEQKHKLPNIIMNVNEYSSKEMLLSYLKNGCLKLCVVHVSFSK
jgi:hypothetical protein